MVPKSKLVNVEDALAQARLTKSAREIALLRRAAHIGDIGQNALIALTRTAGLNEFEMWAELTQRMFSAVGHDIPVSGELVTGPRTCTVQYPNGPRDRVTQTGDAALMDISQRVDGYWSDVTNTLVVAAEPTAHQRKFAARRKPRSKQPLTACALASAHLTRGMQRMRPTASTASPCRTTWAIRSG